MPGKYGPHGELFFFLIKKEPATLLGSETFSPFFNADIRTSLFSADVLKKCVLLAVHVIAEEGSHVPGLGDEWKWAAQRVSPMWESEGEAWSEDGNASSCRSREGNVCNDALHVIGSCGLGDKISFFLKEWELVKVALSHVTAEEGRGGETGCPTPDLADTWRFSCPKSPMWESEGEAWYEDESVSSSVSRANNVCNCALHVIGLYGPGDKVSLFLEDWELARVALSCHIALDILCQEMHEARLLG